MLLVISIYTLYRVLLLNIILLQEIIILAFLHGYTESLGRYPTILVLLPNGVLKCHFEMVAPNQRNTLLFMKRDNEVDFGCS